MIGPHGRVIAWSPEMSAFWRSAGAVRALPIAGPRVSRARWQRCAAPTGSPGSC